MYKVLVLVGIFVVASNANDCAPRSFGSDSIVCVCNATYCDETPEQNPVVAEEGSFYRYTSSKDGLRLKFSKGQFNEADVVGESGISVTLDRGKRYQRIKGFGAAFTDSAGINIQKLSKPAQEKLISSYYSQVGGSRYSLGRVPIAGTDFSTRPYTYDDFSDDLQLRHFALTEEDHKYKLSYVLKALELNPNMKLFAVAWSAPPWMKTNNDIRGYGFLRKEYYQLYAEYLLKFLREYKRYGANIWAISCGNEPDDAFFPFVVFNKMGWTPTSVAEWVAENLGPSLANSEFNATKIIAIDDQRFNYPWYPRKMFENQEAEKYVDILAIHWYLDKYVSASRLDETHNDYPDKDLLMTEACVPGPTFVGAKLSLGSWKGADDYIGNIIENLRHWVTGWVDWNIALDEYGGPSWVANYVDASIIVAEDTDQFYKQPMYYAIKHFSRFVRPESVRIEIGDTWNVKTIAFATPLDEIVVVVYNSDSVARNVTVRDAQRGIVRLNMRPYSIETIVYKN